ncbi:ATPase [Rhodoplanes sp. TEM]|uniref:ATPase n=1 Tax=Rhodoplanes tepidamans TaxID=200616 RepID=A0ABT5JFK5_RHOTP|nr:MULTISPECIES: ATP12 family protein [Rhodoplanes]MDC7788106.1 ATPase [Rhodoplanes tepidamans]MDC7984588.1 ATPase [Rhodoplanes sp. TEM]MDQ0355603.1 chaperone required for assembly of F1-ATPase [Rhodoplanes tepidamans]
MTDLFDSFFAESPADPNEAAKRSMRPLRRRFYEAVTLRDTPEGVAVELDGRPVRTPARRLLAFPTAALAERAAAEWRAQTEVIDPAQMPLTRLANAVIDAVADKPAEVAEEIARYLGSDLLVYRAEGPERLVETQSRAWDPVLAWARDTHGARFVLVEGVVFTAQPERAVAAMRRLIPASPWRLGALHVATALTGSALLALALAEGAITADAAWTAGHVDEDWNMELWGLDDQALARRAHRRSEFDAAAAVLALVPER